jgi:hypothetical protein
MMRKGCPVTLLEIRVWDTTATRDQRRRVAEAIDESNYLWASVRTRRPNPEHALIVGRLSKAEILAAATVAAELAIIAEGGLQTLDRSAREAED